MATSTKLTTEEVKNGIKEPILIVDKKGIIGKELALKLGRDAQIVLLSKEKPSFLNDYLKNILYIPFFKKNLSIPNGRYSAFFIIEDEYEDLKKILPSFLQKAELEKIPLVFAMRISDANSLWISELLEKYSHLRILIYGDYFNEKTILNEKSLVNSFLYQAIFYERIEIPSSGIDRTYPVLLKDVVLGLLEVIFGSHSERLFYSFPKSAPTALSVARMIKKINPDVKIDFDSDQKNFPTPPSLNGKYLLSDNYSISEEIKKIILNKQKEQSAGEFDAKDKDKVENPKFKKFPLRSFLVASLIFIMLPILTTFSFLAIGAFSLWQAQSSFSKGEISSSKVFAESAIQSFSASRATFELLNLEAGLVGFSKEAYVLQQNLEAGRNLSKSLKYAAGSLEKYSMVFLGKSSNPSRDFYDANLELSDALVLIEKTNSDKDVWDRIKIEIRRNNDFLELASSMHVILPEIIGVEGKKDYVFLFQNNMELRPTGGFIGSYGVLSLDKGKMISFNILDVYDADGQLKGHVEPPFPIRRYLPSEHWYLRDSNFDLSFPKSASQAAFFLKIEKNQSADGVIAINATFVKNLLQLTGSLYVSEYDQNVTSDNFFKLAQSHSGANFFPGSTQKKDFLSAVFRAMQSGISDGKVSLFQVAKAIEKGLIEKNILLYSPMPSVQGLFTLNSWSSSLHDNRIQKQDEINDFLLINEANLGVNKVNYFINRKVSKNITIKENGEISSELQIMFENKSNENSLKEDYKNYLRVALPLGAKIEDIVIDGEKQTIAKAITDFQKYENKNFIAPSGLEVENYQQDNKEIYGFLLTVPSGKSKNLSVRYVLSDKLNTSSLLSKYSLKFVKQPGIEDLPLDVKISYPEFLRVSSNSSLLKNQKEFLEFNKDITTDEVLEVSFSKK